MEVEKGWRAVGTRARLLVMLAVFAVVGVVTGIVGRWGYAPLIGWIAGALTFEVWAWASVGAMDADQTATHATRENPGRSVSDALLLVANLASLGAVGYVVFDAANAHGLAKALLAGLAVVSVAISWVLVQTLFTLRYAAVYYSGQAAGSAKGGVDFNQDDPPRYGDFAYLAFTLGMTYQVSDTDIKSAVIRMVALRHGLLSYVFGSVILATTINLVVGLSSGG